MQGPLNPRYRFPTWIEFESLVSNLGPSDLGRSFLPMEKLVLVRVGEQCLRLLRDQRDPNRRWSLR